MTISEQEAREAAAFIADIGNGANEHAPKLLAALMMNILARRDAERAERALPITAEWLASIGFSSYSKKRWSINVSEGDQVDVVIQEDGFATTSVNGRHVGVSRAGLMVRAYAQGQLLDLLAALKGGGA